MASGATLRPASLGELCELFAGASAAQRPLRLMSQSTWLSGGAPVSAQATPVQLGSFSGIVEYEPGDLTITVGAATTIAELDAATAAHAQWCPLAPWGGDEGTVGATIATATAGPYAHALGLPRDLVLGLECVDGTGAVLRPGGKVVKNVAGFDLVRLITGSWGSLAAITRVSLRLRARPAADESWRLDVAPGTAPAVQRALRQCATPPVACELLILPANEATGHAEGPTSRLLVRIAGNTAYVNAARDAVQRAGRAEQVDPSAWLQLRRDAVAPTPPAPSSDAVRALNAGVKQAFDPANILNPGIMG
ncbi:MAG: FAD-binding protein [Gemmatimonadota bacterium]|nr:FAD-binding protein [Gemmatimonadota bacterium]